MEYSNILGFDPKEDKVFLLSWRGTGENIPTGLPVAGCAVGDLSDDECFYPEKFVVLGWHRFSREDMRTLIVLERKFWGNDFDPSVIFERERTIKELANEPRFIEAINAWAGIEKPIKYGKVRSIRSILNRITSSGRNKVYLSFEGEVLELGEFK